MQDLKEQELNKKFLRSIAQNNYEIPNTIDCFDFAKKLLENLASPDGELRDELSYMIIASGIIDKQKINTRQLEELLLTVLDEEHLFYHIGEFGTDSVFMRSFSNLIIAAILYNDSRNPVFSEQLIRQVKTALLRYARQERDWRGYIEGKGWAHAMAHLADALDECAQCRAMAEKDRRDILMTVSTLAKLPEPLYHEEDVRLSIVPYHIILGKQVDDDFLSEWVAACYVPRDGDVLSWTKATNAKNFLRSLYFLLFWDTIAPVLSEQIAKVLQRQDEVYAARGATA